MKAEILLYASYDVGCSLLSRMTRSQARSLRLGTRPILI